MSFKKNKKNDNLLISLENKSSLLFCRDELQKLLDNMRFVISNDLKDANVVCIIMLMIALLSKLNTKF